MLGRGKKSGGLSEQEQKMVEMQYREATKGIWMNVKDMPFTPFTVLQFVFSTPGMVEEEDMNAIQKSAKILTRNFFISSVLGVMLNLQLKRIPNANFVRWNFLLRYLVRIPVFLLPNLVFWQSYAAQITSLEDRMLMYSKR